jgi:hypothetical protein
MAQSKAKGRQGRAHWLWLLAAIVVAWLLFVRAPVGPRGGGEVGLYDPARPVASLAFENASWVPQGAPVAMPEARLQPVGRSSDGYLLYARRELGGGGGAGARTAAPLYLKTRDGRYQPLFRR